MHRKSDPLSKAHASVDRTDWRIVLLVWAAGLGAAAQFGKIAVVLDAFRSTHSVSEVALGFLISCVGLAGLIFGVLGGILSPKIGIRRMFLWGMFAAGILSAFQSFNLPYIVLIALRIVEGVSHLFIVIAGPILMARHSSNVARPAVMTLWSSFFGLSYMLVALVAPWIVQVAGLSGLFLAHGAFMIVIALCLSSALPELSQSKSSNGTLSLTSILKLHVQIYRSPWLSAAALGFVFYTGLYIALLTYLPSFVDPALRVGLSASLPLASIITSLTIGVLLLRYISAVNAVVLGYALIAISAVPLIFVVGNDIPFIAFSLVLLGATGIVPGASFAALASLNVTDQDRAYATGAIAQLGNLGTTSGPPLLAAIISISGIFGTVAFILLFCIAGGFVHLFLAKKRTNLKHQRD